MTNVDGRRNPRLSPEERRQRAQAAARARWDRQQAANRAEQTAQAVEVHAEVEDLMQDVAAGVQQVTEQGFSFRQYLPEELRDQFAQVSSNGDRLSNSEQIALLDLRISQLCSRLDTAESGRRWREVRVAMRNLTGAMQSGNTDAVGEALNALHIAINRGVHDVDNWDEMMEVIETRRRVTETELRRVRSAQEWISTQEALDLITVISESVNAHVTDPTAKALIAADIQRTIGVPGA